MKTFKTAAIIALMTTTVGLAAITPSFAQNAPAAAAAQDQTPGAGPKAGMRQHDAMGKGGMGDQRQNGPRGMGGMIGFERGSEGVEIALVRLSHAVDMTAEQQALFDTFKTDALAAADTFSSAVEGLRPAAPGQGQTAERPDITTMIDTRIAIETAHLAALEAVQPSMTAFFGSLTDAQKAALMPQRGDHDGMRQGGQQQGQHGDRSGKGPMGGQQRGPAAANG
ncbi:MAG: Spy/CpxP family protein refolding chaperone [Devosia sp.]